MRKLSIYLLLIVVFFGSRSGFSQGVSVNNDNSDPHPSAMLDVKSPDKGVLIPRLTKAERDAISSPAIGLLIYQTDNDPGFYYNTGLSFAAKWNKIVQGSGQNWIAEEGADIMYQANLDDRIGIGTATPQARLHVMDSAVVFTGGWSTPVTPEPPPVTGSGVRMMWYPDKGSFRAGRAESTDWDQENIGSYSVGLGYNTLASGGSSVAFGSGTSATGDQSTAFGANAIASGWVASAMGWNTKAEGTSSVSMGYFTEANSYVSVAMGQHNVGGGISTQWIDSDPLFEVGNGTSSEPSNAFTILKNSMTGIGTAAPLAKLHVEDGDVLFAGQNDIPGSPADPPVSGAGVRMMWYPDKAAFRAGVVTSDEWDKDNIGDYSVAMGSTTKATGLVSTAMGYNTVASGIYSTSMGSNTNATSTQSTAMGAGATASGGTSTAMGLTTTASGNISLASGWLTVASGNVSAAFGQGTAAGSYASMAVGLYNVGGGSTNQWVDSDPLFEVGNGTSSVPSNAFTILKNGNIGIGIHDPGVQIEVETPTGDMGLLAKGNYGGIYYDIINASTASNATALSGNISSSSASSSSVGVLGNNSGSGYGVYGQSPSGTGVHGFATGTSGVNYGVKGSTNSSTGFACHFSGGKNYLGGNTGIGITNPASKLHVLGNAKVESNSGAPRIYLDGTSGNEVLEFQHNGAFGASVGYNIDNDNIFFYHGGNVVVKNGCLGVGTATIVGSNKIQVSGGAYCTGTNWYNASDKNLKENFNEVSGQEILEKLAQMDVSQWNYKTDEETVKHIGPMAQDFYAMFELGNDNVSISTVDAAGVSLAAIKALNQENTELKQVVDMLQKRLQELEDFVLSQE